MFELKVDVYYFARFCFRKTYTTVAVSKAKALSNVRYQACKDLKLSPSARVVVKVVS